jgi:hypothetical protein
VKSIPQPLNPTANPPNTFHEPPRSFQLATGQLPQKQRRHRLTICAKTVSKPGAKVFQPITLEADIQAAWGRAKAVLSCANFDVHEVADLATSLRDCAQRASAIGFASGERELLRMARFLEGRISPSDYPRYRNDDPVRLN